MSLLPFLDSGLFASVCKTDEELKAAIGISSVFCVKTFTFRNCLMKHKEINYFCVSTIFLARHKKFKRKNGTSSGFVVANDLFNELRRSYKSNNAPFASQNKHELLEELEQEIDTDLVFENSDLEYSLSNLEKKILFETNGELNVLELSRHYGMRVREARMLIKSIKSKLAFFEIVNCREW